MSESWQIRAYREDDWPALQAAFRAVHPHNPRLQESEYLRWQYHPPPDRELSLDVRGNAIAGWIGTVAVEVERAGRPERGCYLQNWYTRERDGAGLALFTRAVLPFAVRMMLGTTPDAARLYAALRIPQLVAMPRWVAFPDAGNAGTLFAISSPDDVARLRTSAVSLAPHLKYPVKTPAWSETISRERYLAPAEYGVTSGVVRSRQWLNWRYRDIPQHEYVILNNENGSLVIYRVEGIQEHSCSVVRIVEWLVAAADTSAALAEIAHRTRGQRVVMLEFSCTCRAAARGLLACGFTAAEDFTVSPVPSLFRPLHPGTPISLALDFPPYRTTRTLNWEEWYITRGDADLDRYKL